MRKLIMIVRPSGSSRSGWKLSGTLPAASRTLRPCVEDIVQFETDLGSAQPRVLERDLRNVTGIGEQPEIERADRREAQVVAGERVDPRAAAPVGADARAEAVVGPAGLSLDRVARRAAAGPGCIAVQVIELRSRLARSRTLSTKVIVSVSENCSRPRLPPPNESAAAATPRPPPNPPPPPRPCGRSAARASARHSDRCRLSVGRQPVPCGAEAELRAHLVDHGLRRLARLQRLAEVEPDAERVLARTVEIHRSKIDAHQLSCAYCAANRSGNADLDCLGDGNVRDRPINRLVDVIGAQPKVGLGKGLPVAARASTRCGGRPEGRDCRR